MSMVVKTLKIRDSRFFFIIIAYLIIYFCFISSYKS